MKYKYADDKENVNFALSALQRNDGYCPGVVDSHGNEDYKCPCKAFREQAKKGETCSCGLYVNSRG